MKLPLFEYYRNEKKKPWLEVFASALVTGLSRTLLLIIINVSLETEPHSSLFILYGAAFCLVLIVNIATNYHVQTRSKILVESMQKKVRLRITKKLLNVDLNFIESLGNEKLYVQLTQDISTISNNTRTIIRLIEPLAFLVCTLAYIGWLTPIGFIASIVMIILGLGSYLSIDNKAIVSLKQLRNREVAFFQAVSDLSLGFKELRMNRAKRNDLDQHINDISREHKKFAVYTETLYAKSFLTSQVFTFLLIAMLVFMLPYFFEVSSTVSFQFLAAILFLIGPIESIASAIPDITSARISLERIQDLENAIEDEVGAGNPDQVTHSTPRFKTLQLDAVTFTFPTSESDDRFLLGPVDVAVEQGEILFITGGNGSGKSVLLKTLCGLYQPSSGKILVNGQVVTKSNSGGFRELFTTIFSDFHLFRKIYGIASIDPEYVDSMLTKLGLKGKTHCIDNEFTTTRLSTGQRKRIAYLISCLEDKQIFILDEFAAEQDPEFRHYFYRTLLPELKARNKTVVMVTHDDSYFDACDRMIKLDYGKIIQTQSM